MLLTTPEQITIESAKIYEISQMRPLFTPLAEHERLNVESAIIKAATQPEETSSLYLVAKHDTMILGVMGIQGYLSRAVRPYTQTDKPAEIVNTFVRPGVQRQGIGTLLLNALALKAAEQNYTELMVNNGIKNRTSSALFWQKQFGEPVEHNKDTTVWSARI